jgi:hypothetical protein
LEGVSPYCARYGDVSTNYREVIAQGYPLAESYKEIDLRKAGSRLPLLHIIRAALRNRPFGLQNLQLLYLRPTQIGVPSEKGFVKRRNSMSRSRIAVPLSLLSFAFVLIGCAKSSNQPTSSDTVPSPSSSSASATKEAAPRPLPIVVPADTTISVVLDEPVGSKISSTGQTFTATVKAPVEVDGRVAIAKGARASGVVKDAKAAGRFKGGAVLELR